MTILTEPVPVRSPATAQPVRRPLDAALTPTQVATFDQLLAIGADRPVAPPGLVDELRVMIESGTAEAVGRWTEPSLWLSKGQLFTALKCEGMLLAQTEQSSPRAGMHSATAVGIVTHRAIQISYTHPNLTLAEAVEAALNASIRNEEKFREFWHASDVGEQSDLRMQMVSRVTSFLDSWPPLHDKWNPRFEEPLSARVGKLTMSARPDLVLGRPKGDGRQTMLLADFKTGALNDWHPSEAAFYALVAALRFGVPPFRSVVFSLSSGEWTEPDVTAKMLRDAAVEVVDGVNRIVDVLTERRGPNLTAGRFCSWCPAAATCPSANT